MQISIRKIAIFSSLSIIILSLLIIVTVFIPKRGDYSSIQAFIASFHQMKLITSVFALLQTIITVPLFAVLFYFAERPKRIYGFIGSMFGLGYVVCTGLFYFLHIQSVINTIKGKSGFLALPFIQDGLVSYVITIIYLGYVFLAFSLVSFSAVLKQRGIQSWIKSLWIVFFLSSLLGVLGFYMRIDFLELMGMLSFIPYLAGMVLLFIEFRKIVPDD